MTNIIKAVGGLLAFAGVLSTGIAGALLLTASTIIIAKTVRNGTIGFYCGVFITLGYAGLIGTFGLPKL